MPLVFEWDEEKADSNLRKHGVNFDEAKTVFNDSFSLTRFDSNHSQSEERWLELGISGFGRLLVVWYTESDDIVRIIGSRVATTAEENVYEQSRK
jgi:uncharacterized DUF497 family protein